MAAADVDVGYIAGHLGLDQPVIASLTTQPTTELVSQLLQAVASKAHEFDTLYAEKLQTDIELENAVRSSESRSQASKQTAENALKDLEESRQKLQAEQDKRQATENELQNLTAKNASHQDELKALNDKIEALQSSNRTNLSIIESSNKRDETVSEELTKQHKKNVEQSREITRLTQAEQASKGQLSSAKYRQESLEQQLKLTRDNSDWLETELKTKGDEALKYRKEKGARITELQRQNEDARSEVEALKRTEKQLRERLDATQRKTDETLVKAQQQEASFAATVESYKSELASAKRARDMSKRLADAADERIRDVQAERERLRDNYEGEIHRIRQELEKERQAGSQLEEKIAELESSLDHYRVQAEQAPAMNEAPQTPRANGASLMRASSPFGTPGTARGTNKSAITATQAIESLYNVKAQLATEKRRSEQLSEELDNMVSALEMKAPEIEELQSETETLREEIARMSELSQQSFEERDQARKSARKAEAALASAQTEAKILRSQIRDLGTQTRYLVFNIYALEKGIDKLSDEEKYQLERLEKGEITEESLSDMSDTHQFITERFVVYKNIESLQQKNEEVLRITRELAEQMESEDALAAKHQAKEDHDQVEKLQQELSHMTEEAKSIKNTMESYKAERDMFRRIIQQRGAGGDAASMMRESLDDSGRLPLTSIEPGEQVDALKEALSKLQTDFDNFREAQDGVRKDLRGEIDSLNTDKNSLHTERIKLQGEVRLESERREMLQGNYVALQNENTELQKRSQSLSETAAKQDIRTQQVAEELIEARGLLDSMRNETANLKAEKNLWNGIHERLTKDNEGLIEEKNRLNNLVATQQTLENERNLSESEARRRAQAQAETLERELAEARRKLSTEAEETKKLQLRKEYESKEAQKRIDEFMTSVSQLREENVATKTSRDHLQARVDELNVELRDAEERVGRLQPRPTPRPGASTETQELENEIQDLNNEVADLKRELDLAKTHLDNTKAQAEQYKELSQSNEETLEDLRSSQGEYQQQMEAMVEEKNSKVKELEQRIEDMSTELSRSNSELSAIHDSQAEVARRYHEEKNILEEELARLKDDSARHVEAARFHQQDLRAQADVAAKAQQNYEQELVKHGEATKLLQQLRNEHNELKSESATLRSEAESARVTLTQNEGSWEEQRQRLEQEMVELKTRREDVNSQNKLLHEQLDGLTSQVTDLQQRRNTEEGDEGMSPVPMGDVSEGLRELNSYLRREKEILEVQHDLKSQESKRLQQQLDYTQSQLDETRLKLDQERSHATDRNRTSMTHQDLMDKLNELNLYRESSMTLRNENARLKDLVAEKVKAVEAIEAKVQPLEAEVDSLNTQATYVQEEIKQVQEDRDRWRERTDGIMKRYGRVDPAEMEGLKEKITTLETENATLKEQAQPLNDQIAELTTSLETERAIWNDKRTAMINQFKERSRNLTTDKKNAIQKAEQAEVQLGQKSSELDASTAQQAELQSQLENFRAQVEQLQKQAGAQGGNDETAPSTQPAESSVSSDVVTQLEQQLNDARKELESLNAQKLGAEQQLEILRKEMDTAVSERDQTIQQLQESASKATGPVTEQPAPAGLTETAPDTATAGLSDEERKALEEKIADAEKRAAELEEKATEAENSIQATIKHRSDRMKDLLNQKLKEKSAKMDEDRKKLEEDFELKLQQEKAIWKAENPQPSVAAPAVVEPETPKVESQNPAEPPPTPGLAPELSQMDDASMRSFLSSNNTAKSIIGANIKKRVEAARAEAAADIETKVASAREQAQLLESKKSTLRINMSNNQLKAAQAKLGVVATAASETPEKPVGEVWEVAKVAKPEPAAPAAASTPAKPTPQRHGSVAGALATPTAQNAAAPTPTPATQAGATPQAPSTAPPQAPSTAPPQAPSTATPTQAANPFAASADAGTKPAAPNPFANKPETSQEQNQQQSPAAAQQVQGQQGQNQPQRSSIPQAGRGGSARGRGNAQQQGQRNASGSHESGIPQPGSRGGRGGGRGGRGGNSMNPGAGEFTPGGTKRPRGDTETAAGAKRPRGSH